MNRRLVLPVLLALLGLAALPAAASAGWFPAGDPPIDGPSADIVKLGGVDLARDGTGGVVYIKRVGGVPHVFLSRFNGGRSARRSGSTTASRAAHRRRDRGHRRRPARDRVDGGNSVYGSIVTGNDQAPGPLLGPTELFAAPGRSPTRRSTWASTAPPTPSYTAPGGGGTDVRVSRLLDTTWTPVGSPLDINPAAAAGVGNQRSRVGVSAEGNGIVAWGEGATLYARRVTGLNPSAAPQELSVPDLGGAPAGRADSPDIDIEDDGSFVWAVFRQDIGGRSRALARRMLGSTFDPPVAARRRPGPTCAAARHERPRPGPGGVRDRRRRRAAATCSTSTPSRPPSGFSSARRRRARSRGPASSEHRENVLAWRVADGAGNASVKARLQPEPAKPFDPEVELSRPDLGAVEAGGFAVSGDRLAGFAVAMAQGPPTSRADHRRAPRPPAGPPGRDRPQRVAERPRAKLEWRPGRDLWGPQRFRVVVGGRVIGETTGTSLRPTQRLSAGRPITYQVIAIDSRGQEAPSRTRRVRFDNEAPTFKVRIVGKRRAGRGAAGSSAREGHEGLRHPRGARPLRRLQARRSSSASASAAATSTGAGASRSRSRSTTWPATAGQEGQAPHHVRLRAGRRELELGGPPLLMGVVNASPDSFSDAGDHPDLEAHAPRRALVAAGAAIIDVGGESAVGGRPPVPPPRRPSASSRSSRASSPRTTCSSPSTPTSRRLRMRRSRRARG